MKTISKFILRSFAGPFVATFFIALFVLLMQFVWKYVDDMVGKGLEWYVIAELLFYVSASLVPMALPLAILLSSIMTMGNLGEHYELVAFRSAGVSLKRILRPLTVIVIILSCIAFLFSNYWLPIANLKSKSLLYDVKEQKPTIDIRPGIFSNALDDYTIRVKDKKVIDDVEHLYDVLIYDHSEGKGNQTVIIAEEGIMTTTVDKKYLELRLFNGESYDESAQQGEKDKFPHLRSKFKKNTIRFDLSQFSLNRTDEELFKSNYKMLNLKQLNEAIDTLNKLKDEQITYLKDALKSNSLLGFKRIRTSLEMQMERDGSKLVLSEELPDFYQLIEDLTYEKEAKLYETAMNISRSSKSRIANIKEELYQRNKYINYHKIHWHQKLTLSFACLVLFLIGAPLGAIIRKGGLGMPIVLSVIFFIIFHILSITGEKMAKEGAVSVVMGMWMASLILLPVGIFITYKATTGVSFFRLDNLLDKLKKIFRKKDQNTQNISP